MEKHDVIVEKLEDLALLTSYLGQIQHCLGDRERMKCIIVTDFNDSWYQEVVCEIIEALSGARRE